MDQSNRLLGDRDGVSRCDRDISIPTGARRRWLPLVACLPLLVGLACSPAESGHTDAGGDASGDDAAAPVCRPVAPCPAGWFQYSDSACSPPSLGSGPGCSPNGDGLCYKTCSTDDDCRGTGFSTCGSLNFFQGSDVGTQRPACVAVPVSSAPPLCAGADAAAD